MVSTFLFRYKKISTKTLIFMVTKKQRIFNFSILSEGSNEKYIILNCLPNEGIKCGMILIVLDCAETTRINYIIRRINLLQ